MEEKKSPISPLIIVKEGLPPAPVGVSETKWRDSQQALRAKGMPWEEIKKITELRQMNLYTWLVIIMGHPWRWVMNNEETLLDPRFKRPPGQA